MELNFKNWQEWPMHDNHLQSCVSPYAGPYVSQVSWSVSCEHKLRPRAIDHIDKRPSPSHSRG